MVIDGEARGGRVSSAGVLLATALVSVASACSAAPPPEAAKKPVAAGGVARYLPLENDTVFAYDTVMEPDGQRGLLILEVRRRRPELAELVVAGRAQRLNVSSTAIELVTGGALLRAPLTVGASWRGDFGRVRVTNVSRSVTVPAGAFSDCLETIEEMTSSEGTKRTSTVYCPGVGITLRETEVEQDGARGSERIALKSFGKRFVAGQSVP